MIEWNNSEEKKPPLNKNILLGRHNYECGKSIFVFACARVFRPYDEDKKYNPDYYEFLLDTEAEPRKLRPDVFWAEVNESPVNPSS